MSSDFIKFQLLRGSDKIGYVKSPIDAICKVFLDQFGTNTETWTDEGIRPHYEKYNELNLNVIIR